MKGAESTRLRRGTRADIAKLSRLISVIASLRCDTPRARCLPAGLDVLCHPERSEGSSGWLFFNNGRLPRPLCMVPVFAHSLERGLAMTNLSLRSLTPYRNDDSFAVVAATPSQRPCSRRYPDRASCLTGGLPLLAPEMETFRSKPFHRQQLPQEHDKALARRSGGQDELAHPAMIDIHT